MNAPTGSSGLRITFDCAEVAISSIQEKIRHALLPRCDDARILEVELVVEELITNVQQHGYGGRGGPVELALELDRSTATLELTDWGAAFDPLALPAPGPLREEGGRGLTLVQGFVDEIASHRTDDGRNVIHCRFHLAVPHRPDPVARRREEP
jgi:anti-sigma regulatory factor (Ser/Thr protein kinase)